MSQFTTHHRLPPFPSDVPTASLDAVPLRGLESSSTSDASNLFSACRTLGFFYLDLLGSDLGETILREAEELHELQQKFFAVPHEDKDQYGQDKIDPFFSYRWSPCMDAVKDVWGRAGRREMYSLRVDDFLHIRPPLPRHHLISSVEPLLSSFAKHCRQAVHVILEILESRLGLASGSLLALHRDDVPRGDFIALQHRASEPASDELISKGEHTDFGSITMLFNWLGGLQIREQLHDDGTPGRWVYIKPFPGSCVINLADSLVKLSAGVLKSNIHRVAPAPGKQAGLPRYSLVYFAHPNDDTELTPVRGGLVDEARRELVREEEAVITAADWTFRRSLGNLRGVYTYRGGLEWRDNSDAVKASG